MTDNSRNCQRVEEYDDEMYAIAMEFVRQLEDVHGKEHQLKLSEALSLLERSNEGCKLDKEAGSYLNAFVEKIAIASRINAMWMNIAISNFFQRFKKNELALFCKVAEDNDDILYQLELLRYLRKMIVWSG
jgi:hypothetical protein